jgi:hypothetical protein
MTAVGSGPTGTKNGIVDGTATVDYLQATATVPLQMIAGTVEPITDADLQYTFNGTAFWVLLSNRGSSDNTIRRLTLTLRGWAQKPCLTDNSSVTGTTDMLVIDGSCRTLGNISATAGFPVFDLGQNAGIV